jgi:hypothetical protein
MFGGWDAPFPICPAEAFFPHDPAVLGRRNGAGREVLLDDLAFDIRPNLIELSRGWIRKKKDRCTAQEQCSRE